MTNKLFVISSLIDAKKGKFSYSNTRSVFSNEERFRQTIYTINSIRNAFRDAKIVLVDGSENYAGYMIKTQHFKNFEYVPVKELSEEICEIVNTNLSKSLCECALLNTYFNAFKKEIKQFDYLIKTTGRYCFFEFFDDLFTEKNKNKIFFKSPLKFEWNNTWDYQYVDLRNQQGDNMLRQYCTVLYAMGTMHLDKFIDINEACIHLLKNPKFFHYDIETFYYYFTRPFVENIIETEWRVCGWTGATNDYYYY